MMMRFAVYAIWLFFNSAIFALIDFMLIHWEKFSRNVTLFGAWLNYAGTSIECYHVEMFIVFQEWQPSDN